MCKMAHFGNCDPETADQEYCIFHKPNKSEEEAREFYSKFLERFKPRVEEIEVGEKKIKRLVFEEPVDASGYVFPEIPEEPIEYVDSQGTHWGLKFSLWKGLFKKEANFSGSMFINAYFFETIFEDSASFIGTYFKHGFFTLSNFLFDVNFSGSIFERDSDFYRIKVFNNADFSGVKFKGGVLFRESEFRGRTTFSGAIFQALADFSSVQFLHSIDFSKSIIETATFIDAKFCGKTLSFESTYFKQYIKIFPHRVIKSKAIESAKTRFCYPQPLTEAAKIQRIMYERLGDRENADKMFVLEMRAKRKLRMLQAKENLAKAKGFKNKLKAAMNYIGTWIGVQTEKVLADWITEYGTNWRRILTSSAVVIFGTAIPYTIWSHHIEGFPKTSNIIVRFANALYYSLVTFTTLGYGDMHPIGWLKALSAIEALTGAVFMALIVAVIARKWMR